jgi:hypothetical protein
MTFPDLLTELNISFREAGSHHHVSRGWLGLDCPSCSPNSGRFRLGYNLSRGYLSCWVCGYQRLPETLATLSGRSEGEIRSLLRSMDGSAHVPGPEEKPQGTLKLPVGRLPLDHPLCRPHRDYLRGRGFRDLEGLVRLWGIEGIALAPRLQWRLFLPICSGGRPVSWTTRAVADGEGVLRYVTAGPDEEEVGSKSLLYGGDLARSSVVVVEGPLDAIRIGPGAVATLGTGYSRAQLVRLAGYPQRVIVFDSEPGAQRRAGRLASELALFPGKTVRVELDAPDPGSASPGEVRKLRKAFLD